MSRLAWNAATELSEVPDRPGVYLFQDAEQRVLYVGKAASLRARLRSYRRPGGGGRVLIRFLEAQATAVELIVTRTEQEALLLEDTLIKAHQPPHNVRLKDDKSFLMIELDTKSRFPRPVFVRAHQREGPERGGPERGTAAERGSRATLRRFGPFASSGAVRQTLSDLHRVVPLRDCPDHVLANRSRPCLKHQIGLCAAPCVGLIDAAAYAELVERAARILSGDGRELERELEQRMRAASAEREYERAAAWRDRLAALRRTLEGQGVQSRDQIARDVLGLARHGDSALVHRLAFRAGRLVESRGHLFRSELPDEELLHTVITALYAGGRRELPRELVLPCRPAEAELLVHVLGGTLELSVPGRGERRRMLDLAGENARSELVRRERELAHEEEALVALAALADLAAPPEVIDAFDVSNLQGTHVVASRVRMRRGQADRAGYRRFKIKTVEGQDDFASMREAVQRSLRRGLEDGDLPDLIVIDGGAAQLDSALAARDEVGAFDVPIVGLAKARAERKVGEARKAASEERLVLPGAREPLELARGSAVRHLLERLRDEAHRFAITYHRKERGKLVSRLDSIAGLGREKKKRLLTRFGSVAGVAAASVEELGQVPGIGDALARRIVDALRRDPT